MSIDVGKSDCDWKGVHELTDSPEQVNMLNSERGLKPCVTGQSNSFFIVTVDHNTPLLDHVE